MMPHVLLLLLLGILCTTIQADESTESPESPEVTVNTVSSAEGECAHRADDNDRKLFVFLTSFQYGPCIEVPPSYLSSMNSLLPPTKQVCTFTTLALITIQVKFLIPIVVWVTLH